MKEIQIRVANDITTLVNPYEYLLTYNGDYEIHFIFEDAEWNTEEHALKTARFWYNGQFTDVQFEGDVVMVPILRGVKRCLVGVFSGNLTTTSPCMIPVVSTILDYGGLDLNVEN